ncbi:PASTA domain-containing protein [Kribbella sp. NPDC026596]|uniref:PASTA domain-containing protein n=1 Tax=Kribbella sp. NPDC026596 TaxID=3155122 RepID=UPI0033D137A2
MTHRVVRLIVGAGFFVALFFTVLPTLPADAGNGHPDCLSRADTNEWTGSPLAPPDVLGSSVDAAVKRLVSDEFTCMLMNDKPSAVDENKVVIAQQAVRSMQDPDGAFPVVALWLGVVLPDLVGQKLGAAREVADGLGLVVRTSPRAAKADWIVGRQNPAAGAYGVFGEAVELVLEKPVQPKKVPDLVGHSEVEAEELCKLAELLYVPKIVQDGKRPGRVVSQEPQAGESVDAGTKVTADIRREPAVTLVDVPDVVGQLETTARKTIENAKLGFDPRIVKDGPGTGRVVRQSPRDGQVPVGTVIAVEIERAPAPPVPVRTVVPDVVGNREAAAQKAIGAARLKFQPRIVKPGTAVGIVVNQRPAAGTEVDVGTVVTVDLNREPTRELVPVPDLLNRSQDEARSAVERGRLLFELISGSDSPGGSRHVTRQTPSAGELVPEGTTVTVELAADESNWPSWLLPLLIGAGVLAAGKAARVHKRGQTDGRLLPQITAVGRPLTPTSPSMQESGPSHRISVKARLDRGQQYLQEDKR